MTTCRNLINEALGSLGAIAPGAEATADEYDSGLLALSNLMGELHAARGPLLNLDVSTDAVAGENQRLRIEGGAIVSVTLPNSISIIGSPYTGDYGHSVSIQQCYLQGSIDPADNVAFRAPSDGARIEVVGTTQSLYFYRADLNAWVIASPLTLDGVSPLNAHFGRFDCCGSSGTAFRHPEHHGLSQSVEAGWKS